LVRELLPTLGTVALTTPLLLLDALNAEQVTTWEGHFLFLLLAVAAIDLCLQPRLFILVVLYLEVFVINVTAGCVVRPLLHLLFLLLGQLLFLFVQLLNLVFLFLVLGL